MRVKWISLRSICCMQRAKAMKGIDELTSLDRGLCERVTTWAHARPRHAWAQAWPCLTSCEKCEHFLLTSLTRRLLTVAGKGMRQRHEKCLRCFREWWRAKGQPNLFGSSQCLGTKIFSIYKSMFHLFEGHKQTKCTGKGQEGETMNSLNAAKGQ